MFNLLVSPWFQSHPCGHKWPKWQCFPTVCVHWCAKRLHLRVQIDPQRMQWWEEVAIYRFNHLCKNLNFKLKIVSILSSSSPDCFFVSISFFCLQETHFLRSSATGACKSDPAAGFLRGFFRTLIGLITREFRRECEQWQIEGEITWGVWKSASAYEQIRFLCLSERSHWGCVPEAHYSSKSERLCYKYK